jgi:PKD repeat protein
MNARRTVRFLLLLALLWAPGYALAVCPDAISPTSDTPGKAAINDLGEVVWSQKVDTPEVGSYYQLFSSSRGQLTSDATDNKNPVINNFGTVVWQKVDGIRNSIWVNDVGTVREVFPDGQTPAINDGGEIVFVKSDEVYSSLRGLLGSGADPGINNNGDVVWSNLDSGSGFVQIYRLNSGATLPAQLTSDEANHNWPSISNDGEVVWVQDDGSGNDRVFSSAGQLSSDCPAVQYHRNPSVNKCGDLVFTSWDSTVIGQPGEVYRLGTSAPCGASVPPAGGMCGQQGLPVPVLADLPTPSKRTAINDLGEMLWSELDVNGWLQIHSNKRGQLTFDSSHHEFPALNNYGALVWQQYGLDYFESSIVKSDGGDPVTMSSTGFHPSINDAGEVVYVDWGEIYSVTVPGTGTSLGILGDFPDINNHGDLVWSASDTNGDTQIYRLDYGAPEPEQVTFEPTEHYSPAINDSGEVVYEQVNFSNQNRIVSSTRGALTSSCPLDVVHIFPDINSCGDVTFLGADDMMDPTTGTVYRLGETLPCYTFLPTSAPALDSDKDGLPDDYELAHGLNPFNTTDAAEDADGDGISNFAEFAAGTDPNSNQDEPGVPGLTVLPSTVESGTGPVSLTVGGLPTGGVVILSLTFDADNSGTVNGDEWPMVVEGVADGGTAGENFTADSSTVAGTLATTFGASPRWGMLAPGPYIVRAEVPGGLFSLGTFTVTAATGSQQISGYVASGSEGGTPIGNALVVFTTGSDPERIVSFALTNDTGNYTLQISDSLPVSGKLSAIKGAGGFLQSPATVVEVETTSSLDIPLVLLPSDATVIGRVLSYDDGRPVFGARVRGSSAQGHAAEAVTDSKGDFVLAALGAAPPGLSWTLETDVPPGYFAAVEATSGLFLPQASLVLSPGGSSHLGFWAFPDTAWLKGQFKDETNLHTIAGAGLFVSRDANELDPVQRNLRTDGTSDANGLAIIGLNPGSWWAIAETPGKLMVNGVPRDLVPQAAVAVADLGRDETRVMTFNPYYADGIIEGHVFNADGTRAENIVVSAETNDAKNGVDKSSVGALYSEVKTDADGYFRIPVLGGTWTVRATDYDKGTGTFSKEKIIDVITNGDEIIDLVEIYDWNALVLVGNHCSNGIMDFDETGIDTGGSCDPVIGGLPPVAAFTFDPSSPLYCQNVTLDATTSTSDPQYPLWPIVSYKWDVTGDLDPDFSGAILVHGFGSEGDHQVTLYVTDELGRTHSIMHTITTLPPRAPVADAGVSYVISAGASLDLDGSGSYHPDADCSISMTYGWEFDGDNFFDDATGATTTVLWSDLAALPRDQVLPVDLKVVDDAVPSLSDVDTATLTIKMPVANFTFTPPSAPPYCTVVPLDGSGSIHPNGETLDNYAWDINSDGTFEFNSATPGYNFVAPAPGTHTLTLKVTDIYGMTDTYSDNVITASYQTPVAAHGGPYFVDDGQVLNLNASASLQPDASCFDTLVYRWDFGSDGTYETTSTTATVAIAWEQISAFARNEAIPLRVKVEHSADPTKFSTADTNFTISKLTAAFTSGPAPVRYCDAFSFDASGSAHSNTGRSIVRYEWDMGDGGTTADGLEIVPTFTYGFTEPDTTYTVTLKVTDDIGWTDTISGTVTTGSVRAPIASIGGTYTADEGMPLSLDGGASTHPDAFCGNEMVYSWDTDNDLLFDDLTGVAPSILWAQLEALPRVTPQAIALRVADSVNAALYTDSITTFEVSQLTPHFEVVTNAAPYCAPISFSGSTSTISPSTRTISAYEWDFNDDLVYTDASGMSASHAFLTPPGSYPVALKVTDNNGWSAIYSAPVVTAPYQTPVAAHGGPYFVDDGQVLTLDARGSVQLDEYCGDTLIYSWDFGSDGTYEVTGQTTATVDIPWSQLSGFSYDFPHPVSVKVEHSADPTKFSTADTTFTISKLTAAFTSGPAPVSYCGAFPFDASTSAHSNAGRTIQSYAWDFDNDGAFDDGTGEFPTYSFSTAGNHLVSLKVTDDLGWTATTSVEITTAAVRAPVASIGGPYVADEGQPLLLNAGASSHPDAICGNTLVYTWDTNNDGIFGDLTGAEPSIPWTQLSGLTREAAQPLALRVEDADDPGLNTVDTTTFRVSELTAAFTSGPAPVSYCTAFPFDASSSAVTSATRTISSYEWDFNNDGVFPDATGITRSHVFADPATTYTVGLRVTDSNGWSTTTTRTLTTAVVQTPIAAVVGSYSIKTGDNLVLKGDLSVHPDAACGRSLTYAWDIDGDGYDDAFVPNPTIYWAVLNGYEKAVNLPLSLKVTDSAISTLFGTNDGSWSITKIDALPPSGLIVPADSTGTQVPLSWTASDTPGATYTIVESKSGFTRTVTGIVGTLTTLTQNVAGIYSYQIFTVAPGYFDSIPVEGNISCNVNPYAPVPANVSVPTTSTGNQVEIGWTTSGPTGVTYTVVEARDAGFTDISQTVSGIVTPPAILTQDAQGTYYYHVQAVVDGVVYLPSDWSEGGNPCTVVTTADQPGDFVVPASSTTGNFTLTWTVPAIADGFEIEESTTGTFTGAPTYTLPTAVPSFDVTGKAPGTYYYRIRATQAGLISSDWVSGGVAGCNVPDADGDGVPDGLDICNGDDASGDTDVDLTCNDLDTDDDGDGLPDAWEITYTLDPLDATGINGAAGDPDTDSLTNAGELAAGTDPRNPDTDGDTILDGADLAPLVADALPPTGVIVPATSTGNQVLIQWSGVTTPGATYVVEELLSDGATVSQTSPALGGTSYVFTNDVQGGVFFYRVKAVAAGYTESGWVVGGDSCTVILKVEAPTAFFVPASSTTGNFTLTWTNPVQVDGFEIEESTTGSFTGTPTYTLATAVSSFEVTGRTPGTYSYRIRGTKSGLVSSDWVAGGNGCQVLPLPLVNLIGPNGTITTTTPTFTWDAVPGAQSYDLFFGGSTTYTSADANCESGIGQCTVTQQTALKIGTEYFWNVRARNSISLGPYGAGMYFMPNAIPTVPRLWVPTGTIASSAPTFTWDAIPGSESYDLFFGTVGSTRYTAAEANCEAGVGQCTVNQAVTLKLGTEYFWNVRGINSLGVGPWGAGKYFIHNVLPTIPVQISPSGDIATALPTYSWNAIPGVEKYTFYLSGAGTFDFTPAEVNCSTGIGICTRTQQTALNVNSNYFWNIQASNSVGVGPWAAGVYFTPRVLQTAPVQYSPKNSIETTLPTYTWQALPGVYSYDLYITGSTTTYTAAQANCSNQEVFCSVTQQTALNLGQEYFWNVRARNVVGTGPWGTGTTFKPGSVPVPPILISPVGSDIVALPVYTWNAVSGADSYDLYLGGVSLKKYSAAEANCATGVGQCTIPQQTALTLGRNYFWNVRAVNAVGVGPWGMGANFTPGSIPEVPNIVSTGVGILPTYTWDAVLGADGYDLYLGGVSLKEYSATEANCATGVGQCSINQQTALTLGKEYFWNVRAKNGVGTSSWGTGAYFVP